MSTEHPSFLALDQLAIAASLEPARENSETAGLVEAHVASCDQCKSHVDSHREIESLPASLRRRAEAAKPQRTRSWLVWGGPIALAAAAAAGLVFFLSTGSSSSSSENEEYVGVKGSRAVGLYIKRGDGVTLWDGRSPILANDRLRLAVASRGHQKVAVFMRLQEGATVNYELIYQGDLELSGSTLLPKAWRVDGEPGPEVLLVVTSVASIDPTEIEATLDVVARTNTETTTPDGLWIRPLTLAKELMP